jgi:hypothetical protein
MNDLTLLRDHGPDAPGVTAAALDRARNQLMTEIASTASRRRWWKVRTVGSPVGRIRLAIAVAAVLVAAAGGGLAALTEHRPPVPRPTGVQLVTFSTPVFPLDLHPRPTGLAAPKFSGGYAHDEQGRDRLSLLAVYQAADGISDVYLGVGHQYVSQAPPEQVRSVRLNGTPGYLVEKHDQPGASVVLSWERRNGQWITLTGLGRFATETAVRALAATVIDQPQPVPLQVHLAPAGWRLEAFKDDTILTLRDPASGEELTVNLVDHPEPDLLHQVMGAQRASTVRVNGRESDLVQTVNGWFLQVPLPDGSAFHLQAPALLTRQQVVTVAEQVNVEPRRR